MSKNNLFKKLCDTSTVEIGWHLAHRDSRDDFATDPVGYADYAFMKAERFRFIVEQLRHHRYRISRLTDIDVPKTGLSVRPGNVLPIEESTILHSITYLIAPKIDARLHDNVYSYRLAKDWQKKAKKAESLFSHPDIAAVPFLKRKTIRKIDISEPWYEAWPEFDAESAKAVKELGFTHLTKTDITAYFENIELRILEEALRRYLPRDPAIVEILVDILEYWTRRTPTGIPIGRGIPQGNDVSSFLGNIYLIPLDEELEKFSRKKGARWCRYVDDIKVFTKNYGDAREAVFLINGVLRQLHLNLQGSKTEILSGTRLETKLFDPDLDKINTLIDDLQSKPKYSRKHVSKRMRGASEVTIQFTRKLPSCLINLSGKRSRLFRRCLTLFSMTNRPRLRKAAFEALRHLPDVRTLRSSLNYLSKLDKKFHDETVRELINLLNKRELPFPYQVATAIETLKYLSPSNPKPLASELRKLGFNTFSDWYVRQKTIETILVLPYRELSAEKLAVQALEDVNPWVRRAGAAFLVRGSVEWVRQRVESLVYQPDPDVSRIALYWKRHLDDPGVADQTLGSFFRAQHDSHNFIRRIPMIYLLRCHQDQAVGKRLLEYVTSYLKSPNAAIRWHCDSLASQLKKWVN